MMIKLQVFTDGEWGTLNTRGPVVTQEEIEKAEQDLLRLQVGWTTYYSRFTGAQFRIRRE